MKLYRKIIKYWNWGCFFCLCLIVCIYTWIQCPYTIWKGRFYVSMSLNRVVNWGWIRHGSLEMTTLLYHVNWDPTDSDVFKNVHHKKKMYSHYCTYAWRNKCWLTLCSRECDGREWDYKACNASPCSRNSVWEEILNGYSNKWEFRPLCRWSSHKIIPLYYMFYSKFYSA